MQKQHTIGPEVRSSSQPKTEHLVLKTVTSSFFSLYLSFLTKCNLHLEQIIPSIMQPPFK